MRKYRFVTGIISPLLPLWLHWRKLRGKEDAKRMQERFGIASKLRPNGTLLWLHAASVGEANSVLLLIAMLRERFPQINILLTTGTVTSAKLMQSRLPAGVIHQYAPIDTPRAVNRFIWHWRPNLAFWVESEFWPNLVMAANDCQCFMGVINARMSQHSFQSWQKHPKMIAHMLACFDIAFAQSEEDAKRLRTLGAKNVLCVGNLKYDAALLPCDESELMTLKEVIGERRLWLAASTHPGEEVIIAQVHERLRKKHADLLTVIIPRHPQRGAEIGAQLQKFGAVSLRSKKEMPPTHAGFYIADTLGEMGLFYRLCEIVFMGGSLVNHGGQNPLEPARLACTILTGPYTHNFSDIYNEMEKNGAALRIKNAEELAAKVDHLLSDGNASDALQNAAKNWIASKGGTAMRIIDDLATVLAVEDKAS